MSNDRPPQTIYEQWARRGISAASVATSLGFYTAKKSTQIGFGIARGVTTTVISIGSSLLGPFTPLPPGTGLLLSSTVTQSLNLIESIAVLPLDLGQSLTSTSFTLASSSLDVLTSMFGTNEASFSLAEFVTLVRREWRDPVLSDRLPQGREDVGVVGIAKALVAWAALQCATRGLHENRWRGNMREISDEEWTETAPPLPPSKDEEEGKSFYSTYTQRMRNASIISRGSRVFVREDLVLPGGEGQVIQAEIGEKWDLGVQNPVIDELPSALKLGDIRLNLRRLSKIVLGGYGGASLIFFGLPYPGTEQPSTTTSPTNVNLSNVDISPTAGPGVAELKQDAEILAQVVHEADDLEISAGASTLAHARTQSRFHSRTPTQGHSRVPTHSRDSSFARERYPNSIGRRGMVGGVPFPSVSTTNLGSTLNSGMHSPGLSPTINIMGATPTSTTGTSAFVTAASSPVVASVGGDKSPISNPNVNPATARPSWWEILSGSRDQEIFEGFASAATAAGEIREAGREAKKEFNREKKVLAQIGAVEKMPRFWVLTDHARRQIVVVVRGTMSFNELAVDLTCEPTDFEPHTSKRIRRQSTASLRSPFLVHGGMLKLAEFMGNPGGPVHNAVKVALRRNRGYELVLCGHSLGAAVAGLLALLWADPTTCSTVPASGLSVGRRVSAYCIAPPCFTSAELSRLSSPMITSFVYSHDLVSRLSLGSIRDLSRACWWLSDGKGEESCANVIKKSWGLEVTAGLGWWKGEKKEQREEEKDFLLSLRKTLEANMHMADLFPAGNVFWAIHENDIDPDALPSSAVNSTVASTKLRLFQIERVEKVFDQVVFARDMLSSHMPHNYDRMLHEYL